VSLVRAVRLVLLAAAVVRGMTRMTMRRTTTSARASSRRIAALDVWACLMMTMMMVSVLCGMSPSATLVFGGCCCWGGYYSSLQNHRCFEAPRVKRSVSARASSRQPLSPEFCAPI
jgi:hypothetical protein